MILRTLPLSLLVAAVAGCSPDRPDGPVDVPVRVQAVTVDVQNDPVVLLQEEDGPRQLPIWIGFDVAASISSEIERHRPMRPNTHDLAKRVIAGLDGHVERVVVTELRKNTYYAIIDLESRGRVVEIDSRPSDAIAIALRVGAPIFVRDTVFEDAKSYLPAPERRARPAPDDEPAQPIGTSPATPQQSL